MNLDLIKHTLVGKWNFEINECEKWCVDVGQPKDGIHIVDIVKKKGGGKLNSVRTLGLFPF